MPVGEVRIETTGPGLYEVTDLVAGWLSGQVVAGRRASAETSDGLLTIFVRHTSCSLLIQENADPAVVSDLQAFFARLVPDADDAAMTYLRHRAEGPDDMPAHIKSALTQTSISVPVYADQMMLGTWQGVYVFEHRARPHTRNLALHWFAG